jgi:hypothetical protein
LPLWFLYAWLFGVLAPHAISATKTPSATLIAMPAAFLLVARLMVEGWRGDRRALAAWVAVALIGAIRPATIGRFGRGFPDPPRFGGVMLEATWIFEHLAVAFAAVAMVEAVNWWRSSGPSGRWPGRARAVALAGTLVIGVRVALSAWGVTEGSENQPFVAELAGFARDRLPGNAVLLFEGEDRGEHQLAMFLLDRTCYQLKGRPADAVARSVQDAGGVPYVVTAGPAPWPRRFASTVDPRGLYEWQGSSVASGSAALRR